MNEIKKFEAGQYYGWSFYFTDNGGQWKCLKRTAKTVVMDCSNFGESHKAQRFQIKNGADGEYIYGHSAFCYAKDVNKSFANLDWMD